MPSATINRFLNILSPETLAEVLRDSVPVQLPLRTSLYRPESVPQYAYFITSGVASVVAESEDGSTAEVGLIGQEGFTASLHLLGPAIVPTDCFMQIEGTGIRVPFSRVRWLFQSVPEFHDRTLEFVQQQALVLSQIAGCHRLHEAEERLARLLLMAEDRTQSDVINLTQELLGMMLGSNRSTVTMIAGAMQRSGLIEYRRGRVTILNRENLEAAACDCYKVTKRLFDNLYTNALPGV
jgi:CRP-like cAMP-binding protein